MIVCSKCMCPRPADCDEREEMKSVGVMLCRCPSGSHGRKRLPAHVAAKSGVMMAVVA